MTTRRELKQTFYDTMVFTPEGVRHLVAEVGTSQLLRHGHEAPRHQGVSA